MKPLRSTISTCLLLHVYINDFIDENHGIMSLQDINDGFSLRIQFTTYFSVVRNIRS